MATFDLAIPVVLQHEGGWVCNSNDPGGETNFGWSMLMIKRLGLTPDQLGVSDFEPGCLKQMTVETAKDLYLKHFWSPFFDQIENQTSATKIFDFCVNAGMSHGIQVAQQAAGASVDGIIGPGTVVAINTLATAFVPAMARAMEAYYRAVVANRPSDAEFLPNWLHRAAWGV